MLTIKRPTPTTVLYTISTRSTNLTIAKQAQRFLIALTRMLIGLFTFLTLFKKAQLSSPAYIRTLLPFPSTLLRGPTPEQLTNVLASTSWKWISPLSLLVLWFVFRRGYTEESLLVIRGLGVQTSTSSATYLSTAATRFIPTSMIQDVFIHEAFKGFEVKFYLAIVVEGEDDVVVVFPV